MEFDIKKAKNQYWVHKSGANARKIPFLFTFEEWINMWIKSGHYHNRGKKKHQYVMSRYDDVGPYSVDNCFIQMASLNCSQAPKNTANQLLLARAAKTSDSYKKISKALKGRPWTEARRKAQQFKKENYNGI
jgi:hypothetical protein